MWQCIKLLITSYPTSSLFLFESLFGFIGYYIVTKYLMQKQIKSYLPKIIFTVIFMCSLGLLLMYLYQIFQLQISQAYWDFILAVLVIMCVGVMPLCLLLRIPFVTKKFQIRNYKTPIIAIIVIIIYINILASWFYSIKQMKKIQDSIDLFSKRYLNILAQIVVTGGVYIMALMSAYGSVWTPYIYFNYIDTLKTQLNEAKNKTKKELHSIVQQIKNNKYQILILNQNKLKLQKAIQEKQQQSKSAFGGILKSLSFFKNEQKQQLKKVKQNLLSHQKQLQTLNKVHQQSFSIYRELIDQQRKHNISQTSIGKNQLTQVQFYLDRYNFVQIGKMFRIMSFILCIYSLSKIILTVWTMFVGRKLSTDPITRLINFIAWYTQQNINAQIRLYSQYISFGFMGYLMISNVRSFSINMKNFFDFIFRRRKLNILQADTLVLLLSQMYGIYFLSAAILLQSGLPRTYVTNFQRITGKVLLVQHFTLFDKLYFWCCLMSTAFIFVCEYQRKKKMHHIINQRNLV